MPRARLNFDGDNRYTEKEARIHKLTDEVEEKIDKIPDVVDNVSTPSSTDALSANMGKALQDQIDNLSGINKFLSGWNCTTGLPDTDPVVNPYIYEAGNYYIISTVAAEGGTNIRPHGAAYNIGIPSTAIETEDVKVGDWYIYDGMQWIVHATALRKIVVDEQLSPTSKNPVENRAVYSALSQKQNTILDLADIRTGATAGNTAIQPNDNITELTNNIGYQTAGDVASAINDAIEGSKYVGPTAPSPATEGMLWYDTTNDVLKLYNGTSWDNVGITYSNGTYLTLNGTTFDVDTNTIATKTYVDTQVAESISSGGTAPQNPVEGQIWYDTINHILKIYDGTNWGPVDTDTTYTAGSGLSLTGTEFSADTSVLATKTYVADEVKNAVSSGSTAPTNPVVGQLWYDTTNNLLKVWNGTSWMTIQELLVNGVSIKTVNNHDLLGSGNIDIIGVEEIQFVTQTEYDNLPSTKTSDGKAYFVYSGHGAAIVSDEAFSSSWDGITTQAPSKNAIYDVLGDVETLLANL